MLGQVKNLNYLFTGPSFIYFYRIYAIDLISLFRLDFVNKNKKSIAMNIQEYAVAILTSFERPKSKSALTKKS